MSELLTLALAAHGGLDRWNELTSIRARLSVTGGLFASKGTAGQLEGIEMEAQLHEQKVVTYLPDMACFVDLNTALTFSAGTKDSTTRRSTAFLTESCCR